MPKRMLSDYIRAYAGVMTATECRSLIDMFEAETSHHEIKRKEFGYSFVQLNVTQAWPEIDGRISALINTFYQHYRKELNLENFWPQKYLREPLRLKRYLPNGDDGFAPHVDVMEKSASNRFCTAILYLNDVTGGETTFPELGIEVTPQAGRMIIFPPLWLFPHAGMPPKNGPKYILHSYLWYS